MVEGCLERIGKDYPEDEATFRDLWEDDAEKETLLEMLKAEEDISHVVGLPVACGERHYTFVEGHKPNESRYPHGPG